MRSTSAATAGPPKPTSLGHFADQGGWGKVVGDLASLNHHIRQQHPELPIFLLGHSMGSYISMAYLLHHSCSLQGAILSGSNYQPQALYRIARLIARFERWRQGPLGKSALIDFLSFGSFNKAFKPNRTAFDWLSRDPQEVDRYVADPLCGFRCSNQLWMDLLGGLADITRPPTCGRSMPACRCWSSAANATRSARAGAWATWPTPCAAPGCAR